MLMRNDPLERGLLPIMHRYGALLTETDLTMYLADVNYRSIYNIVANTDREFESAKLYLQQIEEGKQGVMLEEDLSNGIKTNPYSNSSQGYITQIIELEQYLRGTFLNEIGLNANYNMKRERLSANETELNEDSLRPLIDVMLEERQKACEEINQQFGTDISVEFGSAWAKYNDSPVEEEDEAIELTSEEEIEDEGQGDADTNGDAAGEINTVASGDVDEVPDTDESVAVEDDVASDDESDDADDESEDQGDGDSGDDNIGVKVEVNGDDNNVEITLDDEITDDIIKEEEDNEDEN